MGSRIAAFLVIATTAIVTWGLWTAHIVNVLMARLPILTR